MNIPESNTSTESLVQEKPVKKKRAQQEVSKHSTVSPIVPS